MREEELEELKGIFEEFIKDHRESLQLVAVYGSATRKTDVEGSDIDVLALVDTSGEMKQWKFDNIKKDLQKLEENNSEYDLHIQPPKPLKKWWELALESEPWVITSIEDLQPLYDPEGLCKTMNSFPGQEHMEDNVKSREMLYEGLEDLEEVREDIVKSSVNELQENVVEASRSIFRFQGSRVQEDRLEDKLRETMVEDRGLMTHEDVDKLGEVMRYEFEDISFSQLDEIFDSGLQFIDTVSDTVRKLEMERREWIVEESFAKVSEVCKQVLDEEKEGKELIEDFKKDYLEEGDLSNEYRDLLDDVLRFKEIKEEENLEDVKGEKLYSTSAKISDFKTAVENITSYEMVEEDKFARAEEEIDVASSQYSALQRFQERISEEFGDVIKASWILSIEELLETKDFTVKILLDEDKVEVEKLEQAMKKAAASIRNETDYRIHPDYIELSDYWRKLKAGDKGLYSELRHATTLYDPEKVFLPIKKMIEDGRLEGTREAIQREISGSIEKTLLLRDKTKVQTVNKIYNGTVILGQSMLVSEGFSVPVQKKVPERVKERLVKEGKLDIETYEKVKHNIRYWKDYEHGEFEEISAEDLNQLYQNSRELADQAKKLVRDGS